MDELRKRLEELEEQLVKDDLMRVVEWIQSNFTKPRGHDFDLMRKALAEQEWHSENIEKVIEYIKISEKLK